MHARSGWVLHVRPDAAGWCAPCRDDRQGLLNCTKVLGSCTGDLWLGCLHATLGGQGFHRDREGMLNRSWCMLCFRGIGHALQKNKKSVKMGGVPPHTAAALGTLHVFRRALPQHASRRPPPSPCKLLHDRTCTAQPRSCASCSSPYSKVFLPLSMQPIHAPDRPSIMPSFLVVPFLPPASLSAIQICSSLQHAPSLPAPSQSHHARLSQHHQIMQVLTGPALHELAPLPKGFLPARPCLHALQPHDRCMPRDGASPSWFHSFMRGSPMLAALRIVYGYIPAALPRPCHVLLQNMQPHADAPSCSPSPALCCLLPLDPACARLLAAVSPDRVCIHLLIFSTQANAFVDRYCAMQFCPTASALPGSPAHRHAHLSVPSVALRCPATHLACPSLSLMALHGSLHNTIANGMDSCIRVTPITSLQILLLLVCFAQLSSQMTSDCGTI